MAKLRYTQQIVSIKDCTFCTLIAFNQLILRSRKWSSYKYNGIITYADKVAKPDNKAKISKIGADIVSVNYMPSRQ